jgi:hypothetical protein
MNFDRWDDIETCGVVATAAVDVLPTMTAATTNGVTISASSEVTSESGDGSNKSAWRAADKNIGTNFNDTGSGKPSTLPTWWNVDFGSDTGNRRSIKSYSVRAPNQAGSLSDAPKRWELLSGNFDTGTFATDTGKWTLSDTQGSELSWSNGEKRTYRLPDADTGTIALARHWRLYFLESNGTGRLGISEIELFDAAVASQVKLQGGKRILNATSIGALARTQKQVIVSDTGQEHSLAIDTGRGATAWAS